MRGRAMQCTNTVHSRIYMNGFIEEKKKCFPLSQTVSERELVRTYIIQAHLCVNAIHLIVVVLVFIVVVAVVIVIINTVH